MNKLLLTAKESEYIEEAKRIAEELGFEFSEDLQTNDVHLEYGPNGLSLVGNDMEMHGDFTKMYKRIKQSNLSHEFIVKASKIKGFEGQPVALDATAGMGEDSLLLAAAGYYVNLYEYNPVIAALLKDALKRASEIDELKDIVARMELHEEDSIEAMKNLDYTPEVIVLDPMFPERQKSASVKKKFQLLQQLECPCATEEELLSAALLCNPRKTVIKRPVKGAYLNGIKPDYSLEGKAIRYDVILGK